MCCSVYNHTKIQHKGVPMKAILVALLLGGVAHAQQLPTQNEPRDVHNYIPGIADRVPDGATGPGVVYTQRAVGKIIAVGNPRYQNYPIGNTCQSQFQQQPNRPKETSSLNWGTVAGGVAGAVVGSQFGSGVGKSVATAVGAGAGGYVGNRVYQNETANTSSVNQECQTVFEQRLEGYSFTAQYHSIQVQGFSRRMPRVGDDTEIIIRSVFYAGN